MYKTFVINYSPSTNKMATLIERSANEVAGKGFEVVSFSITNSGKAITLAKVVDDTKER